MHAKAATRKYLCKTTNPLDSYLLPGQSECKAFSFCITLHKIVWLDPVGCSEGSAEFPNNPRSASRSGPQLSSQRTGTSRTYIYMVICMWIM
jgi:hypothetical protein